MASETTTRKTKERSPSFPFINLEQALMRAQKFYDQEKRGSAPLAVAAKHWGYSPSSSGSLQTVAALKSYGLMEDEGSGPQRKVHLSDLALRILLDKRADSTEREILKRQATILPQIVLEIAEKWPEGLPSADTLNHFLVLERGFSQETASKTVKIIHENEQYTKQYASDIVSSTLKTVSDLTSDLKKAPMAEISQPSVASVGISVFRQDSFTLDEGQVVLRWPEKMSAASYEDFKAWIELQLRKIGRTIEKEGT